jgi:methylthioribulose-1-phosphate dehydratase
MAAPDTFAALAAQLAEVGRLAYARGWALGTSGNFSAVVERAPLTLAITPSGVDKGLLEPGDIVEIDAEGAIRRGSGKPSAEAAIHVAVARTTGAGAVLHTHSIWSTILSARADGALALEGYEMLKGLGTVKTHEHRETLPIIANTQDWHAAAPAVAALLEANSAAHGFLIRGHGLYTWGRDLPEARRHLEILEFLLEVMGRKRGTSWPQ